jgi:cyclopropane fatty-acyl-phospholipid synthase-like methyltransferase
MAAEHPECISSAEHARHYSRLVRDHYALFADAYEAAWGPSFHFGMFSSPDQPRADAIRATEWMVAEAGGFGPHMQLLDVGCGRGGPALEIAEHTGAQVTGIDLLERNIHLACTRAAKRGLAGRTHFLQSDALAMPFTDESFDGVYAFESGCHAADKARYYKECARVLRARGTFVGIDWLVCDGLTPDEYERWIRPVCRTFTCPDLISLAGLRRLLLASGLVPEEVQDLAVHGQVAPNWAALDPDALARVRRAAGSQILAQVAEAGAALVEANRCGAFIVALWRAQKPSRNA